VVYVGRNSLNRPPLSIAQQCQRNLYIVEKYFRTTIVSLTVRVYLYSFSRCCLPNMPTSAKFREIWTYSSSRSSKVDDFGTNRKRIYEFLLVINSNFGPILHRFWDTATYWLKIAYFYTSARSLFPLEFCGEVKRQKTRVMGILCGEGCVILTSTVFDWFTVWQTDRQTDGRTDGL